MAKKQCEIKTLCHIVFVAYSLLIRIRQEMLCQTGDRRALVFFITLLRVVRGFASHQLQVFGNKPKINTVFLYGEVRHAQGKYHRIIFRARRFNMCKRTLTMVFFVVLSLFSTMISHHALSQETGQNNGQPVTQNRQTGPMAQGRMAGRGQMDTEQMINMMSGRIQEVLEMSDEEWTVIGPKLINVITLSTESTRPNLRMMMGMFIPGRGNSNQMNPRRPFAGWGEPGPIATVQAELQKLLEDKEASASEIKLKIIELREEKEKAEQRLAVARNELRELLTIRQEALLIAMGYLD